MHRDHGRRRHASGVGTPGLGEIGVERADARATQLVDGLCREHQTEARVEDREVDAEAIESLVEQPGKQGGRAVECVRGGHRPPTVSDAACLTSGALTCLAAEPIPPAEQSFTEALRHVGAADPREVLEVVGHDLDEMTVAVDHRVAESILDLLGPGRHYVSTPFDSARRGRSEGTEQPDE
jgi:hypothetical protein